MSLRGFFNDLLLGAACRVLTGTGSPESVVTAGVGSLYMRTDGAAGTAFYIKESGTGTTGWIAIGSTTGIVRSETVTLTNAQILALPTTPVTVIAAQGSGFRAKLVAPVSLHLDASAGAYTNVDTTTADLVVQYSGGFWATGTISNDSSLTTDYTGLTEFLANAHDRLVELPIPFTYPLDAGGTSGTGGWLRVIDIVPGAPTPAATGNVAMQIAALNGGSGNFTGGNAANTLKVICYYVVEAV